MTRKRWERRLLTTLICGLVLLGCSLPPLAQPTPTPGPLDLIKAFESAMNRDDTDSAMDLFHEDGFVYSLRTQHSTDKKSLRYFLDEWAVLGSPNNTYRDCQSEGEQVTCILDCIGDGSVVAEAFGLDVIHYQVTFAFQDNKIREMIGDVVSDEAAAVDAAIGEVLDWALENIPETYLEHQRELAASDRSGRKVGELVVEMCREYVEAMSE